MKSIEHIAKTLHGRSQPLSSMATVEASLEAISTTDNNSLEDGQKLEDHVHPEGGKTKDMIDETEPSVSEGDMNQRDADCEEKSCSNRPNEKLNLSKSDESVDSKMKTAATNTVIDSGSRKLRYYGMGTGTFLN